MSGYIDLLKELRFENITDYEASFEERDEYAIEFYEDIYKKNLSMMKNEFDDCFIIEMFLCYNTVFMRSDLKEMLGQIEKQFDTDMWVTLVQHEWNETGESSIFDLMDNLKVGYFEANLVDVCEKVRSIWCNRYGDDASSMTVTHNHS